MKNKTVAILLAVVGLIVIAYFVTDRIYGDSKYPNRKICLNIVPGISVEEISNAMRVDRVEGEWIYFETSPIAAGPIRARMDGTKSKTLELKCSEDGPSAWKLD